ncbi:MAG: FAD-dependent oxidoreductase, partial [Flavitalea sp.]
MKKRVIIVGGGAAGLIAARELLKKYIVTIIEVRPVLGGRIRSFYFPGLQQILEEGPEFIHGRLPITLSLFKEAGIEILPLNGRMFRKENGVLKEQEEMTEGWNELLKKMKEEKENLTINRFLEKHYPGPQNAAIRKQMTGYAVGFDLADPSRAAIKELHKEWSHEGESFRIPSG